MGLRYALGLEVFAFLCYMLQLCEVVKGLYQLEVTVFGYNNPTGRCQQSVDAQDGNNQPGCCDRFDSTDCNGYYLCDSFFVYCLRQPIGGTGRDCSYFGNRMSNVNPDDGRLNFSQSPVLGLENPIILQGLTNAYMGVQLHIEVIDDDSDFRNTNPNNNDDLIDLLLIDHSLPIGQSSPRQSYTGVYDFDYVTMDLSITARCVGNFEGSDCTLCLPGFAGVECEVNIDDCTGVNCSGNGQCVDGINSFSCNCTAGFTGPSCEISDTGRRSSEGATTAILGGILGGIFSLALLLTLLTVFIILAIVWHRKRKANLQANEKAYHGAVDNFSKQTSVMMDTTNRKPHVSVQYTKAPSSGVVGTEVSMARKFDNPIYGTDRDNTNDIRTDRDPSILLSMSEPYHQFDNPIYATEATQNAYSIITDAATHDGSTDRQSTYENIQHMHGQPFSSYRPLIN